MAKKNDALKKHHFWILLGIVPLLVMIAVLTVSSKVGGAIEKRVADTDKAVKEITSKPPPKAEALIEKINDEVKKVGGKKLDLWKDNWDRQKAMYVWPNSPLLKEYEKKNLAFGDRLVNDRDQFELFKLKEVYNAEFSTVGVTKAPPGAQGMVDRVAPTQFPSPGGWQSVIRHVNVWDDRVLTSNQVWLMMEDVWVQRSMLDAIVSVNAQMAAFERVKYQKDDGLVVDDPDPRGAAKDPLRRKFRSRTWEVELEVITAKDGSRTLGGRLINHTDRLQLMGRNNTMILKVWLEKGPDVRPFEFKIGGEFLPGVGSGEKVVKDDEGKEVKIAANTLPVVPTKDHLIPGSMTVSEIDRVEQVFDTRTVPVRRIEAMELGFRDSRHAASQLVPPKHPNFEEKVPDPSTGAGGMGMGMGMGGGMGFGMGTGGTTGTPGSGTGRKSGGGTVEFAINANKKRYIEATPQVRRMPVGVSIVIDQAYIQDALLAFSNSPLRFQITQVDWSRFRGTLAGTGSGGGPNDGGPTGGVLIFGNQGGGGGQSGELLRPGDPDLRGPRGPSGGIRPGGMGVGGSPPGGDMYNPLGGAASTVSESQLTSGLVELNIYGVISLYEKYVPPGEATTTGTTTDAGKDKEPKDSKEPKDAKDKEPKDVKEPKEVDAPKEPKEKEPKEKEPKEKEPKEKEPKEKEPKEKEPVVPDPKGSKMRRRVR